MSISEEEKTGYRIYWTLGLITIVLGVLTYVIGWVLYPAYLEYQRKSIQNSTGYVITYQTRIQGDIEDYNSLDLQIAQYQAADPVKFADLIDKSKQQQASDVCDAREAANLMRIDLYPDRLTAQAKAFLDKTQGIQCH